MALPWSSLDCNSASLCLLAVIIPELIGWVDTVEVMVNMPLFPE